MGLRSSLATNVMPLKAMASCDPSFPRQVAHLLPPSRCWPSSHPDIEELAQPFVMKQCESWLSEGSRSGWHRQTLVTGLSLPCSTASEQGWFRLIICGPPTLRLKDEHGLRICALVVTRLLGTETRGGGCAAKAAMVGRRALLSTAARVTTICEPSASLCERYTCVSTTIVYGHNRPSTHMRRSPV